MLLVYAAADIIALFPVTPGGLGIVEASLSGLLILAGVRPGYAVLATLAYRISSYWLPLLLGVGDSTASRRLRNSLVAWRCAQQDRIEPPSAEGIPGS